MYQKAELAQQFLKLSWDEAADLNLIERQP